MMTDDPATASVLAITAVYQGIEANQQRQAAKGVANLAQRQRRRSLVAAKQQLALETGNLAKTQALAALRASRAAAVASGYAGTGLTGPEGLIGSAPLPGRKLIGQA